MKKEQIIEQAEQNIKQAIDDYGLHTKQTEVLEDITDKFIHTLAVDSSYAKQQLRELFSKSPAWDEKIDAIVINGTRTRNTDYVRVRDLAYKILHPVLYRNGIRSAIEFFADPEQSDEIRQQSIMSIKSLAPKAYTPTKKLSRVFKTLCTALGVADETSGSEFQRLYAQFADELSAKKINFKLYVSINPAHFLTMSNPKDDARGNTLTSCHSLNSTMYDYNNGCSGYARDEVSFIVFTVADPGNPETLNNRKTTRQIFAYRPGSGLLMQSRMYNTSGGTHGVQEDSKLYRDLVQREISFLENAPNLWKTFPSTSEKSDYVGRGEGFGGYADWEYPEFDGHISFRNDCDIENVPVLEIGTYGLCIVCGNEIQKGLYCYRCEEKKFTCDCCEEGCSSLTRAYNTIGEEIYICERCLEESYTYCDRCREYHHNDDINCIDSRNICEDCLHEYYEICEDCGDWHRRENMFIAHNQYGEEIYVCENCVGNYCYCNECGEYFNEDDVLTAHDVDGASIYVCDDCSDSFVECPHCNELVKMRTDKICSACGAIFESKSEEE
jgi:hypothetical protein